MDDIRMTVQWVKDEVENIRTKAACDFEAAHSLEIYLHREVLAAIASGEIVGKLAQDCAREALKSADIKFKRVTA